jgi:hypothetical protein
MTSKIHKELNKHNNNLHDNNMNFDICQTTLKITRISYNENNEEKCVVHRSYEETHSSSNKGTSSTSLKMKGNLENSIIN